MTEAMKETVWEELGFVLGEEDGEPLWVQDFLKPVAMRW